MYRRIRTGYVLWCSAALASAVLLRLTEAATPTPKDAVDYATDVGEDRTVALEDGTQVRLNTQTRIRVTFHADTRDVTLVHGEALFDVAQYEARPFRVSAGALSIRSNDVRVLVRRRDVDTTIAVVRGEVSVEPSGWLRPDGLSVPLQVRAGEEAFVPAYSNGRLKVYRLDETQEMRRLAWMQGCLWFEGESLPEVVAEVNRYNARRLVIADASLSRTTIGGVFRPRDLDSFLRALQSLGIRTEEVRAGHEQPSVIRLTRHR